MEKRWFSTLLALILLSGCGFPATEQEREEPPPPADVIQIGEWEVPGWQYRYWLGRARKQIEASFREQGKAVDWSAEAPEGGTLADCARRQAGEDAALYATVDAWAEARNCQLTEEDRQLLDGLWAQRAADAGGEEAYLARLAQQGLTREQARSLAETGQRYAKLQALAMDPDSGFGPTPEELSALGEEEELLTVDRYLAADPDREQARRRAAEAFAALNLSPDPAEAFSALAARGDDPAGPRTFLPGDGTFCPYLEENARFLKEGQCSGILETDEGFSILLRLPADRNFLATKWLDQALKSAVSEEFQSVSAPSEIP